MAKGSYSVSKIRRFVKNMEKQGVRARRTNNGYVLFFEDGSTTSVHESMSDTKALYAIRATVKRAGLEWPGI